MQLTFLGKASEGGESPTLYATDHGTYIVQGYVVVDDDLLTKLDIPENETVVEVYARLLEYLAHDGVSGAVTTWVPPIVHVRDNGNYVIQGPRLADGETRRRMAIPDHEDALELPKSAVLALLSEPVCA